MLFRSEARAELAKREKEQVQREKEDAVKGYWKDPLTHLIWTKRDNDKDVSWQQAVDYCRNLKLVNYSDWRLPRIEELQGIYDQNVKVNGRHVKGNLQLTSSFEWSSSPGNVTVGMWYFSFGYGGHGSSRPGDEDVSHVLCVRSSGE